jgi:epoxyqueuosine reductase QueG
MDKAALEKTLKDYVENASANYVAKEIALKPELAGMRIFDEPLFGYVSAEDPIFDELKKTDIIGPHFMVPKEWLPSAKSVISIFLPFTQQIREANQKDMSWPADEWLHGRIEGQAFQNEIIRYFISLLENAGFSALAPMLDPRLSGKSPVTQNREDQNYYTSNWSERHIAYAAGLGTFGLSKGLITNKGIAGRFISVICTAPASISISISIEGSSRPYSGAYDYCIRCGACAKNCPAKAISLEKGKIHSLCSAFLDATREKHKPRYGCGKCQVRVPCENRRP